jgi:hypothetical protein
LAAGKLVGVPVRDAGVEADLAHDLGGPGQYFVARASVHHEGLGDKRPHRHARIQGPVRILEDHLHAAAQSSHLALREAGDFTPVEQNAPRARLDQAQDEPAQRALAAAALAHETQGLAAAQIERDVVDRAHDRFRSTEKRARLAERLADPIDAQERRCLHRRRGHRAGAASSGQCRHAAR